VDCLTLWLTNILCQHGAEKWQTAKNELINLLSNWDETKAELILVSNEVGHGIVPMGELSRQFVDESGWLHQAIAELAEQVDFVMAGLPLNLKSGVGNE
jgi:adenosylcobinamide kinase/adenosylcobinamide-phosphate guanylyltransferase